MKLNIHSADCYILVCWILKIQFTHWAQIPEHICKSTFPKCWARSHTHHLVAVDDLLELFYFTAYMLYILLCDNWSFHGSNRSSPSSGLWRCVVLQ